MTLQSKRGLIQAIRRVYRKASKKQKIQHLDHLELVTELKRNYLNRLLLAGYKVRRKRLGRQSRYVPYDWCPPPLVPPHHWCMAESVRADLYDVKEESTLCQRLRGREPCGNLRCTSAEGGWVICDILEN